MLSIGSLAGCTPMELEAEALTQGTCGFKDRVQVSPKQAIAVGDFSGPERRENPTCSVLGGSFECTAKDSKISILDVCTGRRHRPSLRNGCKIICLSDGHPEDAVFTGDCEGVLRKWSVTSGELEHCFEGHTKMICALLYHADEHIMFSASADGTVRSWNLDTEECMSVMTGHTMMVTCLAMNTKDSTLFSGSGDRTVKKWDIHSGKLMGTLAGHHMPVVRVEVLEAENKLVTMEWGGLSIRHFALDTGLRLQDEEVDTDSTTVILL